MKHPVKSYSEIASVIRSHVAKGQLEEALQQFKGTFLFDKSINVLGRLRILQIEEAERTIRAEEADVRKNQIRRAILNLALRLDKGPIGGRPLWMRLIIIVVGLGSIGVLCWWVIINRGDNYSYKVAIANFEEKPQNDPFFAKVIQSDLENKLYQIDTISVKGTSDFLGLLSKEERERELGRFARRHKLEKGLMVYGTLGKWDSLRLLNCRIHLKDLPRPKIPLRLIEGDVAYLKHAQAISFEIIDEAHLLADFIASLLELHLGDPQKARSYLNTLLGKTDSVINLRFYAHLEFALFGVNLTLGDLNEAKRLSEILEKKLDLIDFDSFYYNRALMHYKMDRPDLASVDWQSYINSQLDTSDRLAREDSIVICQSVLYAVNEAREQRKNIKPLVRPLENLKGFSLPLAVLEALEMTKGTQQKVEMNDQGEVLVDGKKQHKRAKIGINKTLQESGPCNPDQLRANFAHNRGNPNAPKAFSLSKKEVLEEIEGNMVQISGGKFSMGSARENESPANWVSLKNFEINAFEITQAQWEAIMGYNPSRYKNCLNCPVDGVSWEDVQDFIRVLNSISANSYRLPTEAEWEYAARAGSNYTYAGGNNPNEVAWYWCNSSRESHPVGTKQANAWGLYDMSGNVYEWCQDLYYKDYYSNSPVMNQEGTEIGDARVLRGGSWTFDESDLRITGRYQTNPSSKKPYIGFRLARGELVGTYRGEGLTPLEVAVEIDHQMVHIPGGTFEMGSTEGIKGAEPIHQVSLNSYEIGKFEITQAQWEVIMGNNPSFFNDCPACPVENISWLDAQAFIKRLNIISGKQYRLPTEAEWEYAARAGSTSKYSGGNSINSVAWYTGNSGSNTHPVGTKKPNSMGLFDMSGNVWEWCQDWYSSDYYSNSPRSNPKGPNGGSSRVQRGGSWLHNASDSRVTYRSNEKPEIAEDIVGIRLARGGIRGESRFNSPSPEQAAAEIELNMVWIDGGEFPMGADIRQDDAKPVHLVRLSNFEISKFEVTQAQWQAIMGNNPSKFKGCVNCPVEGVSWEDAQAFIRKLNAISGKKYRLPTEAEWEYAARAGSSFSYAGSNSVENVAWCKDNSNSRTHPVGTKRHNDWGLFDMSGNVWEWCQDWYSSGYYFYSPYVNPPGPMFGDSRVLRGGSYLNYSSTSNSSLGVSYRSFSKPSNNAQDFGIRLARTPF